MFLHICQIVTARTNNKQVVKLFVKSDFVKADIGEKYIRISAMAAEDIKEAKAKGYPVLLPKGSSTEITPGQIIIKNMDELQAAKNIAEFEVSSVINYTLESLSIMDVYAYTALFAKFCARGIFITDENIEQVKKLYEVDPEIIKDRNDAYVDILMSRSEENLQDLADIADAQAKMKRVHMLMRDIKAAKANIRAAKTVGEVEAIKNDFLSNFNFPSS